jgi:hypothetical protein
MERSQKKRHSVVLGWVPKKPVLGRLWPVAKVKEVVSFALLHDFLLDSLGGLSTVTKMLSSACPSKIILIFFTGMKLMYCKCNSKVGMKVAHKIPNASRGSIPPSPYFG